MFQLLRNSTRMGFKNKILKMRSQPLNAHYPPQTHALTNFFVATKMPLPMKKKRDIYSLKKMAVLAVTKEST